MHKTILIALALLASAAQAQPVYRCTDATGKVQLSDTICDRTAVDASRVRVQPNTLDGSEGRALELRQENDRLRSQLQGERENNSANRATAKALDEQTRAIQRTERQRRLQQQKPVYTQCEQGPWGSSNCVSRTY